MSDIRDYGSQCTLSYGIKWVMGLWGYRVMGFKSLSFQITTSFLGLYAFNNLNYGFF